MKKVFEVKEKCRACNGTGLYYGMGEGGGIAVVCHDCKGTGEFHFRHEYEDFAGRIKREDIIQVAQTNPGYKLGAVNGSIAWVGGMPYEEWLNNKPFAEGMEMREITCPCWWYQCTDYDRKPDWNECLSSLGRSFSGCKHFETKEKCWERWDKENGIKQFAKAG